MKRILNNPLIIVPFMLGIALLAACSQEPADVSAMEQEAMAANATMTAAREPNDVIATVGDQSITYGMLGTMLNSSAVVGLSVPAVGTPQRVNVMITLLDKVISANLLYLDALQQGADKDPVYQQDLQHFSDSLLAGLYQMQLVHADTEVTEEEIQAFYKSSISPETELNDETRTVIVATLRKQKADQARENLRQSVRTGVEIEVMEKNLHPEEDAVRSATDVLATVNGHPVSWGDAEPLLLAASQRSSGSGGRIDPVVERRETLNQLIDRRIMTLKARDEGLEQGPLYQKRMNEYTKTRLITFHRRNLLAGMEPSEEEIVAYYNRNRNHISVSEERKIQMVVLATREEAESIRQQIDSDEITIYEAARDHSIHPNAKQTLGEMGWVPKGSGFPELDKLTFSLGPDEIGGPIESPAGWHLVKVLDVREAQLQDIEDANTRKFTRRTIMHERLNEHVIGLRQNEFEVVVYEDRLNQLAKEEAEWVATLEEKAQQPASVTEQRKKALEEFMQQ